jgi:hypothetical protein
MQIELAVDLSYHPPSPPLAPRTMLEAQQRRSPPPPAMGGGGDLDEKQAIADVADYGPPPKSWIQAPFYTYRVRARQKELGAALVGRKEDAASARLSLEETLVSLVERVRPALEKNGAYHRDFVALREAEDRVRLQDAAVADEHGAHAERLRSIDARLSKVEEELERAHDDEVAAVAELEKVKEALARAESKAKRAEIEQRAARTSGRPES